MDTYDVMIVGGGPAGIAAAIYASERKLSTILIESGEIGGQLIKLYPDKPIYDVPSYQKILARELVARMNAHLQITGINIQLQSSVTSIERSDEKFIVHIGSETVLCSSVILATGMGYFEAKKLGVSGESELANKGITYQKAPDKCVGKRVVIIGGGDTALETAIGVAEKGGSAILVHRKDQFRAQEKTQARLKQFSIPVHLNYEVTRIVGENTVQSVEIKNFSGEVQQLTTDFISICIGSVLDTTFTKKLNIALDRQAIVVDEHMQSSQVGIFACGDIVVKAGMYKRITAAQGSAAHAVNGAYQYLKNPYWKK